MQPPMSCTISIPLRFNYNIKKTKDGVITYTISIPLRFNYNSL